MWIFAYANVTRNDDPVGFPRQLSHPSLVGRVRSKSVLEMHDLVLRLNECVQALR